MVVCFVVLGADFAAGVSPEVGAVFGWFDLCSVEEVQSGFPLGLVRVPVVGVEELCRGYGSWLVGWVTGCLVVVPCASF